MSSSPRSLSPPSAPSEVFTESSLNHGAAAGSSHFQGVRGRDMGQVEDDGKERAPKLNPFAKEFIPIPGPTASDLPSATREVKGTQKQPGDRRKDINNGWRQKGALESGPGDSVTMYGKSGNSASSRGMATSGKTGASNSWQSSGAAGSTPPGGRKGQTFNANYLLNFQYDPIPRPPPRAPPPRRQRRSQPYNKELFLQANFRFLVSDLGDYVLNASDPDKMLQWEDVAAVNVTAPAPVQCPICLDSPPLCPQITSCGHIFCFPCILRYLMLGDQRGDPYKKCPLCFAMISCKDLRTVCIDSVPEYRVGDRVKFNLLTRAKGSIIPFEKSKGSLGALAYSKDCQFHLYAKFTLTSDAESITDKAVAELTAWSARVELEGGEDLEILPFVHGAVDQLQQRKQLWVDHRTLDFLSSSPPVRQRIMSQPKAGFAKQPGDSLIQPLKGVDGDAVLVDGESEWTILNQAKEAAKKKQQQEGGNDEADIVVQTQIAMAKLKEKAGWVYESAFSDDEEGSGAFRSSSRNLKGKGVETEVAQGFSEQDEMADVDNESGNGRQLELEDILLEAPDTEDPYVVVADAERKDQDVKKDQEERDSYTFYQSADGQSLILHPLSMKCLLQHYGDYELLPSSLEADIVEVESVTQTDATRKRYRYLSHLPLTANFQLCEVDLSEMLPSQALAPFGEEIRTRQQRRRRRMQQDKIEKAKEERTAAAVASRPRPPSPADFAASMASLQMDKIPTSSDFEDAVGDPTASMSSPPSEERVLFSNVTKLGYASACDAPLLSPAELVSSSPWGQLAASSRGSSNAAGLESGGRGPSTLSFADVIQAQGAAKAESEEAVATTVKSGKKNKKGSMVLLSTAGGRRY